MVVSAVSHLTKTWERIIFKTRFNKLGAIRFEKDVRAVGFYMVSLTTTFPLREKLTRLNQMAMLLDLEELEDLYEIWGNNAGAITWRLTDQEVRRVLASRVDFHPDDVNRLRLWGWRHNKNAPEGLFFLLDTTEPSAVKTFSFQVIVSFFGSFFFLQSYGQCIASREMPIHATWQTRKTLNSKEKWAYGNAWEDRGSRSSGKDVKRARLCWDMLGCRFISLLIFNDLEHEVLKVRCENKRLRWDQQRHKEVSICKR